MRLITDVFKMISDIRQASPLVDKWGAALNIPQLIGGIIFFRHPVALAILAACIASVMIAAQIHRRKAFSRLSSVSHIVFLPVIPFLLKEIQTTDLTQPFGYWLIYVAVTMSICLALDVLNIFKYAFTEDRVFARMPKDLS